ncbi:MAG: hypothetical protein J6K01_01760 [Paludibacteraceae bacterium]|nr:hypothetical protein [Paludibacteraceae bacterium]
MKDKLTTLLLAIFCIPCVIVVLLLVFDIHIPGAIEEKLFVWILVQVLLYPVFKLIMRFIK